MNESERSVSSLMDTWISLRDVEADGERNRILYLLKSRGMSHSKQMREYELTDDGIQLTEPYLGPDGVLTGAARMAQEAREREAEHERREQTEQRKRQTGAQARRARAPDRRDARRARGRGGRGFEARSSIRTFGALRWHRTGPRWRRSAEASR